MTEPNVTNVRAKVVITQNVPVIATEPIPVALQRIDAMELFRWGFMMMMGAGCALPFAMLFATITGAILWVFMGGAIIGMLS